MKLYELAEQYQSVESMLSDGDMDVQAIQDTLESIGGEIEEKADNIACIVKDCLTDAEALKREADSLNDRAKAKKARADWLMNYLYQQMSAVGKTKIETARNLVQIKSTRPAVKVVDEKAFIAWATLEHEEFLRQKAPEVNKTAVSEALKAGQELPGVTLEGGEKLYIK